MKHAIREAIAAILRSPLLAGLSAAMTGLALFVFGLFALVAWNLSLGLTSVEERVAVVAYLEEGAGDRDVTTLQAVLTERQDVMSTRYISKEDALREVRGIPEFGELFEGLDTNPLPASIEVQLAEGYRDPESVRTVGRALESYPLVEEVQFGEEWVDAVYFLRRVAGLTALLLGGGFALVGALIIGAAVRVAVYARRDEIYIMKLVGARNSFIRAPFLLEGALTGLAGGVLAVILTWIVYRIAGSATYDAIGSPLFEPAWIPVSWTLLLIVVGATLGTVAVALAVGRYLREV